MCFLRNLHMCLLCLVQHGLHFSNTVNVPGTICNTRCNHVGWVQDEYVMYNGQSILLHTSLSDVQVKLNTVYCNRQAMSETKKCSRSTIHLCLCKKDKHNTPQQNQSKDARKRNSNTNPGSYLHSFKIAGSFKEICLSLIILVVMCTKMHNCNAF